MTTPIIRKCNFCKDDIHPACLKEFTGSEGNKYYLHYICFNKLDEQVDKTLEETEMKMEIIKNKILMKILILKLIVIATILYFLGKAL